MRTGAGVAFAPSEKEAAFPFGRSLNSHAACTRCHRVSCKRSNSGQWDTKRQPSPQGKPLLDSN